jgi:hypothetical protein
MSAEKCQNGGISRDSAAGNDNISFGVADMYFCLFSTVKIIRNRFAPYII